MSHHASGPNFGFPRGDARLDMTDLYAFTKPGDPDKSILILNVHPSFRLDSPEPTTSEPFKPGALYEFKIDTNGDAVADVCYSVQFASSGDGEQSATMRRLQGMRVGSVDEQGEVIVQRAPVSIGKEALVTQVGDFRFFFGWRSDPFFFDVNGNFNHMQFTGDDFFKDKNVCSIALELPNSELGTNKVGIWARTVDKTDDGWIQADRGGRPLQASSSREKRKRTTLAASQQMTIASSACLATSWNTRAATRPRTPRTSRVRCYRTFFLTILASRCATRTMAAH
jgi:hypothetical protein